MRIATYKSKLLSGVHLLKNKETIVPMLVFLFGLWYFCLRILGTNLEYIPGDIGDSRFINFLLENGHQWMIGNTNGFWDANFMFPFENTIAISDNMIGTMPIYSFWRMSGFSYETSYQLWWIVICSLNFWSTFFVVKKWFKRWDLAIITAWIFAFTIFNFGQLGYMQMIIRFCVPIVFYAGTMLVDTKKTKYLALLSFGIVFQFYCVIYTGFFLMYFSIFFIFLYALIKKEPLFFLLLFRKEEILKNLLIIGVSITAMLWLFLPYLSMSEIVGFKYYHEAEGMLPTLKSYLFPNEATQVWMFLHNNSRPSSVFFWLHYNFMGLIPTLGLISFPILWLFWWIKKKTVSKLTWSITVATFIIFLFFFKTESGASLYHFIFKLPGMNSIRVMNRFIHVTLFMILIGIIQLLRKTPRKWSYLFFLLVFFDNSFVPQKMIRQKKQDIAARRSEVINLIRNSVNEGDIAFALIDNSESFFVTHIDAMQAALELQVPTLNGYSSAGPLEHSDFFRNANKEGLERWLKHNNIKEKDISIIYR